MNVWFNNLDISQYYDCCVLIYTQIKKYAIKSKFC